MKRIKLKYLATSINSNLTLKNVNDFDKYSVFGASGLVGKLPNYASNKEYLGIVKDGAGIGRINEYPAFSSLVGTMSYIYPQKNINRKWLKYAINSLNLEQSVDKTTIPHIYFSEYGERYLFVPDINQQQKIADFLDEKVKEIDNAIEKTKETIELYKKYKQAVITDAVTKGLDPNVEMKSINVRGINKIPKTWSVVDFTKVNYIRGRLGWKGLKADEYVDQGYPFLSAFNIINDKLSWDNLNYITQERYDESPEIKLKENDLLLVKDGNGIGKCAFIDSLPLGETTVNSSLAVITPLDLVNYKYEYYFFLSAIFQNVIWLLKNGMGVPHLTQESMKNIKMPLPPIKEQIEIALYLENKCNYIDKVISKEESTILMLEKYKKSLIYECVTGKRSI